MAPVAQNLQPSAQPAWLDTHRVRLPRACLMSTLSMAMPSLVRRRHLRVPSLLSATASGVTLHSGTTSVSFSRSALGRVVTSSHERMPLRRASSTCLMRYAGSPQPLRIDVMSSLTRARVARPAPHTG